MLRTKEQLKSYYEKDINYVVSEYKDGKITTRIEKVKVYNPYDYTKIIVLADKCDIVIGSYSANSQDIWDFNKTINLNTIAFEIKRHNTATIFNYCWDIQLDEVKEAHYNTFKEGRTEVLKQLKEQIQLIWSQPITTAL